MEQALHSQAPEQELPKIDMGHPAAEATEQALRLEQKPATEGKTAAEYTDAMLKYHQQQYHDKQPPKALKWIGDAALAVPPKSRLFGALGLVGGLSLGGAVSNAFTGYTIGGEKAEKVGSLLKPLRSLGSKLFKAFDPKGIESNNKYIKYLQVAIYSLGGGIGAKLGSDFAYHDRIEKNKNPQYVEDYLMAVSHHQGETWSYLAAGSSVLASSSGMWLWGLLVPGANYGEGLAGFITSMQDRNTMIPYLNEITSGATTSSYLRLKEGAHYLCEYAVGNPSQEPTNIEFLAYTILGPLFRDKLTAEHIKQFTDTVQAVRSKFWEEGGIPKNRRKEALSTMKEVFTGAGLEVLLIDMGLNPATIAFDHVNGLIGKIGDIGQKENIQKEQNAFWSAIQTRLPKYVEAGEISQERADWVVAGIEAMKNGTPQPPLPEKETFKEPDKSEIETAIANSEINICHDTTLTRNHRFSANADVSLGASIRHSPIRHLIEAAAQTPGDWRENVIGSRQSMSAPVMVE